MDDKNSMMNESGNVDSDILFSRTVKAGKRVYYIDVKSDRRGERYISFTESKRLKDAGDGQHPVFEKHKIFLYREDLERFLQAFNEVAEFTLSQGGDARIDTEDYKADWDASAHVSHDDKAEGEQSFRLDIDF